MKKHYLTKTYVLAFLPWAFLTANSLNGGTAERYHFRIATIRPFVQRLLDGAILGIVEFESERRTFSFSDKDGQAKKFVISETAISLDRDLNEHFAVKGNFRTLHNIVGEMPKMGRVDRTVPLDLLRGSEMGIDRLRPLLRTRDKSTTKYLVLLPNKNGDLVSDGVFLGPIDSLDVKELKELSTVLANGRLLFMKRPDIERMLDQARNPWMLYLCVLWLSESKCLDARHFGKMALAVPDTHLDGALRDMLEYGVATAGAGRDLAIELGAVLRKSPPSRQLTVMKVINDVSSKAPGYFKNAVDARILREAIREFQAAVPDSPRSPELIRELDVFLKEGK